MPYLIPQKKIAVFFSPKSGGTSIRSFLFHLENGFPFTDYINQGKLVTANALVRNVVFSRANLGEISGFRKFAVVRNPIERFLSGYSNRVGHYKELSYEVAGVALLQRDLEENPSIDKFVERFHAYRKSSRSINRHFFKQQRFIGDDIGFYEKVFRLDRIPDFVDFMNDTFSSEASMPRLQTGGEKLDFFSLSAATKDRILSLCESDIAFDIFPDMREKYYGSS